MGYLLDVVQKGPWLGFTLLYKHEGHEHVLLERFGCYASWEALENGVIEWWRRVVENSVTTPRQMQTLLAIRRTERQLPRVQRTRSYGERVELIKKRAQVMRVRLEVSSHGD